jgi:tRNA-dihydrouridine synthase B
MKQFATWFTHGVAGGAKLRAAIYQARTGAEVLAQVELFFAARLTGDPGPEPASESEPQAFPQPSLICD